MQNVKGNERFSDSQALQAAD